MVIGHFCFLFCSIAAFPEFEEHSKILYGRFGGLIEFYPILIYFRIFENFGSPFVEKKKTGT